jgi:hypothetical protein
MTNEAEELPLLNVLMDQEAVDAIKNIFCTV